MFLDCYLEFSSKTLTQYSWFSFLYTILLAPSEFLFEYFIQFFLYFIDFFRYSIFSVFFRFYSWTELRKASLIKRFVVLRHYKQLEAAVGCHSSLKTLLIGLQSIVWHSFVKGEHQWLNGVRENWLKVCLRIRLLRMFRRANSIVLIQRERRKNKWPIRVAKETNKKRWKRKRNFNWVREKKDRNSRANTEE